MNPSEREAIAEPYDWSKRIPASEREKARAANLARSLQVAESPLAMFARVWQSKPGALPGEPQDNARN